MLQVKADITAELERNFNCATRATDDPTAAAALGALVQKRVTLSHPLGYSHTHRPAVLRGEREKHCNWCIPQKAWLPCRGGPCQHVKPSASPFPQRERKQACSHVRSFLRNSAESTVAF